MKQEDNEGAASHLQLDSGVLLLEPIRRQSVRTYRAGSPSMTRKDSNRQLSPIFVSIILSWRAREGAVACVGSRHAPPRCR